MDVSDGSDDSFSNHELAAAEFLLKSQSFEALLRKDKEPDLYKIKKSEDIESNITFSMVVQRIKTGSRADQVYLESSDVDYIYEVGPLIVKCSNKYKKWHMGKWMILKKKDVNLSFENTENPGFYRVYDDTRKCVEPRTIQTKIAPMIPGVIKIGALEKPSAALPLSGPPSIPLRGRQYSVALPLSDPPLVPFWGRQNSLQDHADSVVALKCQEWPQDVWEKFKSRNLNHLNLQEIKGNDILQFNFYY